jgi:hypothetical protein
MKFKEGDYILLPKVQYYNFNMSDKYSPSDNGMYELLEPDDAWRIIYAQSLTIGVIQQITNIRRFEGVVTTDFTYVNGVSGKTETFEFYTSGGTYHGDLIILTLAEVREYKLNKLLI